MADEESECLRVTRGNPGNATGRKIKRTGSRLANEKNGNEIGIGVGTSSPSPGTRRTRLQDRLKDVAMNVEDTLKRTEVDSNSRSGSDTSNTENIVLSKTKNSRKASSTASKGRKISLSRNRPKLKSASPVQEYTSQMMEIGRRLVLKTSTPTPPAKRMPRKESLLRPIKPVKEILTHDCSDTEEDSENEMGAPKGRRRHGGSYFTAADEKAYVPKRSIKVEKISRPTRKSSRFCKEDSENEEGALTAADEKEDVPSESTKVKEILKPTRKSYRFCESSGAVNAIESQSGYTVDSDEDLAKVDDDWKSESGVTYSDSDDNTISYTSSEEECSSEGDSDEDDGMRTPLGFSTPKAKLFKADDLTKLASTPELLQTIQGRSVKRMVVDSPVSVGSLAMSPNPESYFLAENRIKFRKTTKVAHVMNDAMKGKLKGRRKRRPALTAQERLPEQLPSNFSVTAEAIKAQVDSKGFIPGKCHDDEVLRLLKNVVDNQFPDWIGLFLEGYNVMMYGYGSKLRIFQEFENRFSEKHLVVRVNGLFPKLNAKKFLYGVCENILSSGRVPHSANLETAAREISTLLSSEDHSNVFILINNFDSMVLRHPAMLSVLCWLTQVPFVHILASCDTVNAFLGVTQSQALQLKFCWMHTPTFRQYREELKWIPGIYGHEMKSVTQKSSLKYVLQSLTGNARKAFGVLAQLQLKQMKSHATQKNKDVFGGVRFQELAKECREKFIAHSDDNLRTLLVEFFDHHLIKQSGKGKHVENTLLIELDAETLEEVMPELA